MSWIKVIFYNVLLTLSLLAVLLLLPPIGYKIYFLLKNNTDEASYGYSDLDLYKDFSWVDQHFIEFNSLGGKYYDYISWRRDDFKGETINIIDGNRITSEPINNTKNKSHYWFFGGSTTWGTGVTDDLTYPSVFAMQNNSPSINFGESGYISRQELALLQNIIIEKKTRTDKKKINIVFFDGVNDVAVRCRSEAKGISTHRESQIQSIFSSSDANLFDLSNDEKYSFRTTFMQLTDFLAELIQRVSSKAAQEQSAKMYNCDSDINRADEIAKTLIETWRQADKIATSNNMNFVAILQPVAYFENPKIEYLGLNSKIDEALSNQYEIVYPKIKELAKKESFKFIDLTDVYDGCSNCYIDFCHVGPQGNELLVSRLINEFKLLKLN